MADRSLYKKKNDFSCTSYAFNEITEEDDRTNHLQFVHSIATYAKWLDAKNIAWDKICVYTRRKKEKEKPLAVFRRGDIIPHRPDNT